MAGNGVSRTARPAGKTAAGKPAVSAAALRKSLAAAKARIRQLEAAHAELATRIESATAAVRALLGR